MQKYYCHYEQCLHHSILLLLRHVLLMQKMRSRTEMIPKLSIENDSPTWPEIALCGRAMVMTEF